MSTHGWSNDSTWGVAGACDNTFDFQRQHLPPILVTARAGNTAAAADMLRTAVAERNALNGTLPSWVDLGTVDWTELVTSWAGED